MYHQNALILVMLLTFGHKNICAEAQGTGLDTHLSNGMNWSMMKFDGTVKKAYDSDTISCYREGLYSHPYDCTKFYRCVDVFGNQDYMTLSFKCQEGTKFSPQHRSCISGSCSSGVVSAIALATDHNDTPGLTQEQLATSSNLPSGVDSTITLATDNYAIPEPNLNDQDTSSNLSSVGYSRPKCLSEGRVADPDDCGQFYNCVRGSKGDLIADRKSCFGEAFDSTLRKCVPVEMVEGCLPGVTGEFRNTDIDDPKLQHICRDNENKFVCLDCKTLLLCAAEKVQIMPCKYGNVCHNDTSSFVGGVCYPAGPAECTCNEDDVFQPDMYDPSKFLSCGSVGADPIVESCPEGLQFNTESNSCGAQINTTCSESGTFALESNCTMYHSCTYTTTGWFQNVFECLNNTMYNEQTGQCEDPCQWYDGNFTCTTEGRFSNLEDCTTFFECIENPADPGTFIEIEHICPEGFAWLPMVNSYHCVARGTTNETCEPRKPHICKIPSEWCTPTTVMPPTTITTTTNAPTTTTTTTTTTTVPTTTTTEIPAGFENFQGRIIRRTLRTDPTGTYDSGIAFCENKGLKPFVPITASEHGMYNEVQTALGATMWLPINDRQQEGVLQGHYGEVIADLSVIHWCGGNELFANSESYDCLWYAGCSGYHVHFYNCNHSQTYPPLCEKQ